MSKKACKNTIIVIITIIVLMVSLIKPIPDKKELAKLKSFMALEIPEKAELFFSEGIDDHWNGEGTTFFAYKLSDNGWNELLKKNDFSKWNALPISKEFRKDALKKVYGMSEQAMAIFTKGLLEKSGYSFIANWELVNSNGEGVSFFNDKIVICIIGENTNTLYFYEIDL